MSQHPATGTGISPHPAHLYGGCVTAAVTFPAGRHGHGPVPAWLRSGHGNLGEMHTAAGLPATEFRTLDFHGT